MITDFSTFFSINNKNLVEFEFSKILNKFNLILSDTILNNNLNIDYTINIFKNTDIVEHDIHFKTTNILLYNEILNKINNFNKENKQLIYYLSYKEYLNSNSDHLIIFYTPLLFELKKEINDNNIYQIELNDEYELVDFIQTYLISFLFYNNEIIKQINYLRSIGYGQLVFHALYTPEILNIINNNAKNIQLSYLESQEYLNSNGKKKLKVQYTKTSYQDLLKEINNKEFKDNFINNLNYNNLQELYNIFKISNELIKNKELKEENEYYFVKSVYEHFYGNERINPILITNENFIYSWINNNKNNSTLNDIKENHTEFTTIENKKYNITITADQIKINKIF